MKNISKSFTRIVSVLILSALIGISAGQDSRAALLYTSSQYKKIYNEKVALELEVKMLKRQYRNDKTNLEAKIRELSNKADALERELDKQKKQNAEDKELADKRISELEKRTDILKAKGSRREKELIDENRELQKRCEGDISKLRDELEKERGDHLDEVRKLKDSYEKKIEQLEKKIANLNDELAELKKLTEKQKEELERMESQAKEFEKKLAAEIKNGDIRLKRFHDKLIINIDDRISFDSGSADLKKEIKAALNKITKILSDYPENQIIIEGHTDNVPIHTSRFRNNWQLSTERALSVLEHLLRNRKLNASRFSAAGYGEFNPIVPNDSKENRALNRRVDIVVVPRLKELSK